jgi:hypothetical protein
MLSPAEVRKEIPENLLDKWIVILRTMILGSNDTEQCSGLQALSICAGYSKRTSVYLSLPSLMPTKGEMRKKILKAKITSPLLKLFHSHDDVVKYCASLALITLDGGSKPGFHFILPLLMPYPDDPQPSIPAKDIIAWLVMTVGRAWRHRRTVKFLSKIIQNSKLGLPSQIGLLYVSFRPPKGLHARDDWYTKH